MKALITPFIKVIHCAYIHINNLFVNYHEYHMEFNYINL